MVSIDLHGLTLANAKEKIRKEFAKITNATKHQDRVVTLIHGHNNGTVIRDYIRNGEMEKELKNNGTVKALKNWGKKKPGKTTVLIVPPGINDLIHTFNRQHNFGET